MSERPEGTLSAEFAPGELPPRYGPVCTPGIRWTDVMFKLSNFCLEADIPVSTWTHVAGTYRTSTRRAKVYINGESTRFSSNSQLLKFGSDARVEDLSWDWACANIGDYKNERPLDGYVDDFFIFKCELMDLEIKELFETGSFKRHGIPVP